MQSKERVQKAIHFQGPDRVPHYLPDGLDNDILWLWPKGVGPKQPWTNYGEEDIRNYVRKMVATLGAHNGGLISKTYPTPDDVQHDPKKIAVACAAFREFGVYGA